MSDNLASLAKDMEFSPRGVSAHTGQLWTRLARKSLSEIDSDRGGTLLAAVIISQRTTIS